MIIAEWKGNGNEKELIENCNYCCTGLPQRQCPVYGKNCSGCGMIHHFYGSLQDHTRAKTRPEDAMINQGVNPGPLGWGTLHDKDSNDKSLTQ